MRNKAPLSRGRRRYHEDKVLAEHTVSVAVTFRLYDKLGGTPSTGAFKKKAREKLGTEGYWIYLFQDSWDESIRLAHEIYVDAQGGYNHVDCHGERDVPNRPPGVEPHHSVLLSSAHYQKGDRRPFRYYVLFSPFQVPDSRIDYILPGGKIQKGQKQARKQFIDWAKARELNVLVFTPAEERKGTVRSLWAPWLKAQAMADEYDAAVYQYAKAFLDQQDKFKVADIVQSLSKLHNLPDYVSMENIKALYGELPRVIQPCKDASDRITQYLESPAIQEMLLDMWADDTEDAHHALFPFLANFFRAARTEKLLDWADSRFFDFKIDPAGFPGSMALRRAAKALWEINSMFATALTKYNYPAERLNVYVRGTQWYLKKIFRTELKWTEWGWDRGQIDRIRKMAGKAHLFLTFLHCLDTINVIRAYSALTKDPASVRANIALIGAFSSQISTALKTVEAMTKPTDVIDVRRLVASSEKYFGPMRSEMMRAAGIPPAELPLMQKLAEREEVLKALKAMRWKPLTTGLGLVSGTADAVAAFLDLSEARDVGDHKAAVFFGLVMVGGALVALSPFGLPIWAAALGQGLELAGLIGAGIFRSTDIELWLRFCCFGNHSASTNVSVCRGWTGGRTLGQLAASPPGAQVKAFYDLVYDMTIAARRVRFERIVDQLDLSVSFACGCPKGGQVYLRVTAFKADRTVKLVRPLTPWENPVRKFASDKKTVIELSQMFDGSDVLLGVKRIEVEVWLDVDRNMEFYPDRPLLKSFHVSDLPSSG